MLRKMYVGAVALSMAICCCAIIVWVCSYCFEFHVPKVRQEDQFQITSSSGRLCLQYNGFPKEWWPSPKENWIQMGFGMGHDIWTGWDARAQASTIGSTSWWIIPDWFLVMVSSVLPVHFGFTVGRQCFRAKRHRCQGCGYDLRADGGRCSECGR